MSKRNYWLMKSEPEDFSIDDLEKVGTEPWDGVRNYQARNYMRDKMEIGDGILFYHSNISTPAIVGTMEVASKPYADPTQFDPDSKYFDPKSSEEEPTWQLVDVTFIQKFENPVTRDDIKVEPELQEMVILRQYQLSVTPVTEEEWNKIHEMAGADPEM